MDLNFLTIVEAHQGLISKQFTSEDLVKACQAQIEKSERLNTFITRTDELALQQARKVDAKIAAGEEIGVLEGIPAGMKDIFNTRGIRTTVASRMLENFVPPYESTATRKLLEKNYVLMGKMNLDEFACGTTSEFSFIGPSLNPWDQEYTAGGSSGGSVAAVSAGQIFYSLGTDTGGSIRLPASWSGCVGLKVTYGRVSRFGVTSMASSLDTIGPMARSVADVAHVLQAIAGHDPFDATTPDVAVPDYTANLTKGVKGLRIGVPKEYFMEGVDDEVRTLVMAAIKEYEKMGATVQEVSLPMTKYGVAIYYVLVPTELSTNLARMDGIRFGHKPEAEVGDLVDYYKKSRGEGFGTEIKRRIMVGTFVSSAGYADAYYKQALKARTLVCQEFASVFKNVDVLMAPVVPSIAFKVGENLNNPLALYMADILTLPSNVAGIPALSVPCGFTAKGLPVGLQIIGPHWSEPLLFQAGAAYEQVTDWKNMHPKF
jgi:aspartyl-tRNA(Asn)/glutamyl-tRNA(Gln) amidotransferase subunit A